MKRAENILEDLITYKLDIIRQTKRTRRGDLAFKEPPTLRNKKLVEVIHVYFTRDL